MNQAVPCKSERGITEGIEASFLTRFHDGPCLRPHHPQHEVHRPSSPSVSLALAVKTRKAAWLQRNPVSNRTYPCHHPQFLVYATRQSRMPLIPQSPIFERYACPRSVSEKEPGEALLASCSPHKQRQAFVWPFLYFCLLSVVLIIVGACSVYTPKGWPTVDYTQTLWRTFDQKAFQGFSQLLVLEGGCAFVHII